MRLRRYAGTLLTLVAGAALLLAACEDDQTVEGLGGGGTEGDRAGGVNVEAILDDVEEVRLLLGEAASTFDPGVIADARYADGLLTVTVTEEIAELDEASRLCDDLSQAIAARDVRIEVQDQGGARLADCQFGS